MNNLIRITTIYNEVFIRVELRRTEYGIFTTEGYVPFDDIQYIDILGKVDSSQILAVHILGDKPHD